MSKIWFITGASSGLGHALAEAVLERGDRAIAVARRSDALQRVALRYPETALAVTTDLTDAGARAVAIQSAIKRFPQIDVLANIAGQGSLGAAEEFSPQQLHEQMELNFFAVAELTRLVLPSMRARGSGHILNLTSIGGLHALRGFSAYCASKFALEGWSEALADEIKPFGISLTIVEPGLSHGVRGSEKHAAGTKYRRLSPGNRADRNHGKQAGDPRKAAYAMIAVVDSPTPPLRLLLGADAISLYQQKRDAMDEEITLWREIGAQTAFDDAMAARPPLCG